MLDVVVQEADPSSATSARSTRSSSPARCSSAPDQLPQAWADHVAAYARLDLQPVPNLFMTQVPFANAAAVGRRASRW